MMATTAILISRSPEMGNLVRPLAAAGAALELATFSSATEAGERPA